MTLARLLLKRPVILSQGVLGIYPATPRVVIRTDAIQFQLQLQLQQ
jgi:hypothetical protein